MKKKKGRRNGIYKPLKIRVEWARITKWSNRHRHGYHKGINKNKWPNYIAVPQIQTKSLSKMKECSNTKLKRRFEELIIGNIIDGNRTDPRKTYGQATGAHSSNGITTTDTKKPTRYHCV